MAMSLSPAEIDGTSQSDFDEAVTALIPRIHAWPWPVLANLWGRHEAKMVGPMLAQAPTTSA
eukprot:918625-Prorocentrum_lima.AAC.1